VDQIETQLDQLQELSDDQVAELQNTVIAEFEQVEQQDPTPQSVDSMTALANMLDTVRGEAKRREAQVSELAAKAADATMRVRGEAKTTEEDIAPADETEDPSKDPAKEEEKPAVAEASTDAEAVAEFAVEDIPPVVPEEGTPEEEIQETPAEEALEIPGDAPVDVPVDPTEVPGDLPVDPTALPADLPVDPTAIPTDVPVDPAEGQEDPAEEKLETPEEEDQEVPVPEVAFAAEDAAPTEDEPASFATETPVDEETPTQKETPVAPEAQKEAPVTAAAEEGFVAPADRRPVAPVTLAPVAITAGADIPGYTAGSTMTDMSVVASAMEKRLHSLRRVNGGDGEQHIVASISTMYPESRTLSTNAESNAIKINDVVGPEALVASGGHATPFEVKYDVFGFGSDVRPVRDSLPRFQADRGGIRFITPPQLKDYTGATGVWTVANDIAAVAPNSGALAKASLTVTGAQELTAQTDAVTLQLQFGNLFSRAYPELLARHNELGLIQHARESEKNLLTKIGAASTAVTTTNLLGFGRDFLVQVKRASTAYRSRHRIPLDTNLKAIIPSWVYDAISADLTLAMPGDSTMGLGESEINGYLSVSNVTLTSSPDLNVFGVQSTGALLEFPDTFTWYLFSEGSFLFLDGGTLDIGIIRDSSLVGTNDYKMFVESFEGLAFVGIESLAITSTINVNGAAAALRDTLGGVAASVIEL